MSSLKKKVFIFCFLFSIVFLGFYLRYNNFTEVPTPGESADEYSFTWLGLSLIEMGVPIATSGLAPYEHHWKYINVEGFYQKYFTPNPFPIDQPWFDHPPLFGLVVGGHNYLYGVRNFVDTNIHLIRRPVILIGVINLILVMLLSYLVFNLNTAIISGLIFATEPLVIISSRIAQAENLLITFFLGAIISLLLYYKKNQGTFFWLAISLAGLATLTKFSGWSVALSLILIILAYDNSQKFKKVLLVFTGTLGLFIFFPLFGAIYDWNLFQKVFLANSDRFYADGFNALHSLFLRQNVTRDLQSGWVTLGWIASIGIIFDHNKLTKSWWIILPLISYFFTYLFFGSQSYGWYKFPFYPFLVIALSFMILETFKKPNLFFNIFLIFLPGGAMLNRIIPPERFQNFVWQFRFFLSMSLGVLLAHQFFPKNTFLKGLYRCFLFSCFIVLIILNIYTALIMDNSAWLKLEWIR
jgi:4-amino-4-deoxy-L-arabinose transferase-like glycosyltransferase